MNELISEQKTLQLADLIGLLADSNRLRILFALFEFEELTVGQLSTTLALSEDATSYGLKILRGARLVEFTKSGRRVTYRLANNFPNDLLEHCLRQLLALSEERK